MSSQTIWITGASRGIGEAIARALASGDVKLALSARKQQSLAAITREIKTAEILIAACDVRDLKSITKAHESILLRFGDVDVLINNAGIAPFADFLETSVETIDDTLATNLRGAILTTRAVLPAMIKRKGGIIINILSVASRKAFEGSSAYCASKYGLLGFSEALREEVRKHNIKVINVLPGAVETEMWDKRD